MEENSSETQGQSVETKFLSITKPTPTGPNNVQVLSPYMTKGTLCQAYGPVSVPSGFTLVGVYAKVVQGVSFPHKSTIYPTGYDAVDSVCAGGNWNLNKQLTAFANSTTMPAAPNNKITIVTVSRRYIPNSSPPDYELSTVPTNAEFFAVQGACPIAMPAALSERIPECKGEVSTEFLNESFIAGLHSIEPIDRVEDWLLYRMVSAERFREDQAPIAYAGPVLMLHGEPLRARVAAFAAGNICWRHSLESSDGTVWFGGVVRRAIGELIPADSNFLFRGAPRNSIVLSQPSHVPPFATSVNVLASESRSNPDYFHLDPEEVIRAQVNFDLRENVHSGQFDLWVKVIDD